MGIPGDILSETSYFSKECSVLHQKWSPCKCGCQETILWRVNRDKGMPDDTRSGLKISGNRSYGMINPPQNPDLNFIEALWEHLDTQRNKRQRTSKAVLWNVL